MKHNMKLIKKIIGSVPGVRFISNYVIVSYKNYLLSLKKTDDVFGDIYKCNTWEDEESISGPGSTLRETIVIREELPKILARCKIESILDIPCGDFNWLKEINLEGVSYTGADIVYEIIKSNKKYETDHLSFVHLNLIKDSLPSVDLILIRDCLVHFSFSDIDAAIKNICKSESKYLLTTTFVAREKNKNIVTGDWSPLNLQVGPFFFPKPVLIINEKSTSEGDKSLALWKITDIKNSL
jgi:hypothetical protein